MGILGSRFFGSISLASAYGAGFCKPHEPHFCGARFCSFRTGV
jgi:hypothetical protein